MVVRLNALGRVEESSPMSYPSKKKAAADALTWNEMDAVEDSSSEVGP